MKHALKMSLIKVIDRFCKDTKTKQFSNVTGKKNNIFDNDEILEINAYNLRKPRFTRINLFCPATRDFSFREQNPANATGKARFAQANSKKMDKKGKKKGERERATREKY